MNIADKYDIEIENDSAENYAIGRRYRVEVGNAASSDYIFCSHREEAQAALAELVAHWESSDIPECQGENITEKSVTRLNADEDGEYDPELDEILA